MDLLFLAVTPKIKVEEELPIIELNNIKLEEPEIKPVKKDYVRTFINKHQDKIKEKHICEICYSTYTYFNKSKHNKTKRHLTLLNARHNTQNIKLVI